MACGADYLPRLGWKAIDMRVPEAIVALATTLVFSALGAFASQLAGWLRQRPRAVAGLNIGAGLGFVAAGLSILALQRRG